MLTLDTTVLVAAVFLRALVGYLRNRDPWQRDIILIFVPTLLVTVNGAIRDAAHHVVPLPMVDRDDHTRSVVERQLRAGGLPDRVRLTGKVIGTVPRATAAADGIREWIDLAAVASTLSDARQEGASA